MYCCWNKCLQMHYMPYVVEKYILSCVALSRLIVTVKGISIEYIMNIAIEIRITIKVYIREYLCSL